MSDSNSTAFANSILANPSAMAAIMNAGCQGAKDAEQGVRNAGKLVAILAQSVNINLDIDHKEPQPSKLAQLRASAAKPGGVILDGGDGLIIQRGDN